MNGKKGFTLIEILIVVALLSAVSLLMYSFFGQGLHLYAVESESANEQMNMRQALSEITNRARLTEPEDITYDSGALTIGSNVYTLEGGSIKRDGTVVANDIFAFNVSVCEGYVEIEVVNSSGNSLSTSLSTVSK